VIRRLTVVAIAVSATLPCSTTTGIRRWSVGSNQQHVRPGVVGRVAG
jgi:hypothetical protein